jgi:monomeric sarcosine oxidase
MTRAAPRYDAIVLGVGGMGSAACWRLAKRGARVLGLEQHALGHALGSSHGETRLIRRAYFESPDYVPLLNRAYELWDELATETRQCLFHRTGLVIYGAERAGGVIEGIRRSARSYGIPIEPRGALPGLSPPLGHAGVLEPDAGYLEVESCVLACAAAARAQGATILADTRIVAWREADGGVEVETADGERHRGAKLVVTAGPWAAGLLPRLSSRLSVHRVPLYWFKPARGAGAAMCFGFELEDGFYYGMPDVNGRGVKVGLHVPGELVPDPARIDRGLRPVELEVICAFVRRCLPDVDANGFLRHAVCMYTMSPDENFVIDHASDRVVYAAGFSGHGFKFASVVGEVLADMTITGRTAHPVGFLRYRWRDD